MKKMIILAVMLFLLVSCSDAKEFVSTSRADDEADIGFLTLTTIGGFCESPDAYYYVDHYPTGGGSMIYFIDKQTGFNGALCSKPECAHDSSDCSADVPRCSGLSFYKGRLWWVGTKSYDSGNWVIFSSKPDGTDRKAEREIDAFNYRRDGIPDNYGCATIVFHKGYLYISYTSSVVEDGVPCAYIAVTRTSLSKNDETEEILYERVETQFDADIRLIPAGDKIYFYTFVQNISSDENFDFKVYEYGEEGLSELYRSIGKKPPIIPHSFAISPDGQLMFSYRDTVYILKNGEFSEAHSFKDYAGVFFANDRIAAINPGNMVDKTVKLCITDYKFKTLYDCSFNVADLIEEPDATSYFCFYMGLGTDAAILRCQYFKSANFAAGNSDSSTNDYYILVPVDGSEAKIVSEFHR